MKMRGAFLFISFIPGAYGASVNLDEPKTITAPKIEYNVKSEEIRTTGQTEIVNQSGQKLTLMDSYLAPSVESLAGGDMELWLGNHVYVKADRFTRDGAETVAHDAMFTACEGCDPYGNAWEISATTFIHDATEKMMYFHNSVFWVYDLPVLYWPYFEMPDPSVRHKSGLLMPNIESTNKMGTQINLPVHIALSDTHDLTLRFSYLTQENPLFHGEHRLNTRHGEFRTQGSFTHNKMGENRWHIFNDDVIELGEYARATVYLERASDKTYLQKYGFYDAQPYLDSGAKLELFGQSSYAVADMHVFQELRSTSQNQPIPSGDILPNIRGVHQTAPFFHETYATFGADVLGISGDGTSNQRMIGMAAITSPWTLWGGNRVTLNLSGRYDIYNFHNTEMLDGEIYSGVKTRFLPSGYAEWGLPLMRAGQKWTQIIEPRARLTVMRELDQAQFSLNTDSAGTFLTDASLFSSNRFAGLDLWENGTFADYGVRYAAYSGTDQSFEIFLGQSYDFSDRVVADSNSGFHDGLSDYVGRIRYNRAGWLTFNNHFRIGEDDFSLRHIETNAHVGTSRNFLILGHLWSAKFIDLQNMTNDTHEMIAGAGLQLAERWSVRFNATYNFSEKHFQRHSGGVFYNHPCYYLSLEYRRDNSSKYDYVGTTTFQFRFGMSIDGKQYK